MKLGLFGSLHSLEMMKEFGIDDEKVARFFDNFRPDIICGEVREEDYLRGDGYMGPGEYKRFIFDYCKKNNIKFVPCDSYDDTVVKYLNEMNGYEVKDRRLEKEWLLLMEEYMKAGRQSDIPFNSDEYNAVVARKQAFQSRLYPIAQEIVWDKRNTGIVNNILSVIKENPDKDILVVFGAEHIYWLKDAFSKIEDIELVFPIG